ncbi:TDP-N-acetylfucosamine:lipid II N-acetylfucosaminyltransferase [Bacillus sp. SD088]|uniref:TDP-N-acetylfucosamine:lipid II N-acetylfucosaminyltransferase n=1 Tax=Bacillus sp. SD088 TaxID=2782012 RepID=UPI001A96FA45|nr:TDP-N-acetylfucosamine:lipid II N-acetylfucosaminyltransferase [Bacillus sp. SD088]MBO0991439.1 TDP-N-acetylfucosamine:lipid II N-acetylfucosaminyltransferase [Bacillus sp. SD088]
MSILHIQKREKFTDPFNKFIEDYFDEEDHFFAIRTNKSSQEEVHSIKNNKFYVKNSKDFLLLIMKMNQSDKIFLHSLLIDPKILVLLFFQPWILKKCYWILWGADLYKYKKPKVTFKQKTLEFVRKFVIKNMYEILPIVEGDYRLAKDWYHTKAKYRYNAIYPVNTEIINKIELKDYKRGKDIQILLGNSATESNKHEDILRKLSKFKDENIKLYVPLSYGNSDYAEKIISIGKSIFEGKFIPITEFMDRADYINLLNTMDVGIFNNDRQQAMGNIYLLLYLGKKVFIRKGTTMWDELNEKYYLSTVNDIEHKNLNFLCNLDEEKRDHNKNEASIRYDINKVKEHWINIFSD